MRCLDRVRLRAALIVVGLIAAALVLWDGQKVRRTFSEESPGRVRIGEVVHAQVEIRQLLEDIRRSELELERLRIQLGELEHTYSQPRL